MGTKHQAVKASTEGEYVGQPADGAAVEHISGVLRHISGEEFLIISPLEPIQLAFVAQFAPARRSIAPCFMTSRKRLNLDDAQRAREPAQPPSSLARVWQQLPQTVAKSVHPRLSTLANTLDNIWVFWQFLVMICG